MPAPNDPELMLAAACCRWPPSPARDAAVREAAGRVRDWGRFRKVVHRQRAAGLVHAAMKAADLTAPAPHHAGIAQEAATIIRRNLTGAAETARLIRLIEGAGYPVLAVKGMALAALAYGTIALKHSKDIDLLILPEHAGPVISLLEADHYHLTFPAPTLSTEQRATLPDYCKDVAMVRPGYPQLELHWRLFPNPALLAGLTARSRTQVVTLSGQVTARTLETPDLFAYLATHGVADGWSRLKWLADANALLAPFDEAMVARFHDHAVALGVGRSSAVTLLLCHDLFGLPLAPDFAARLAAPRRVRMLLNLCYRLLAVRDGATELYDWRGGQKLLLLIQPLITGGLGYHWQTLRWMLFVQTDMYQSSAPPRLYFLYPLLRLPLWIGRRLSRRGAPAEAVSRKAS